MKRHLIEGDKTIVEALEALNRISGETMTLFVKDGEGHLVGSLTDGDIRRAILAGRPLTERIDGVCRRDCLVISEEQNASSVIAGARERNIALLPVVDARGIIVSLIDLSRQRGLLPADGVLMAGGRGERLRPLTEKTPKPLLPVGGRPIIDYNVDLLRQFGISDIFVTVNYRKEMLIDHFSASPAGEIRCVEEPRPLGTIGSLSLIEGLQHPHIVVMNADLLTDINLEAMYLKHIETEAWLTMAAVPYTVSVPYAIVDHDGDRIKGFVEKPTYNYYANSGVYMLRREALEFLTPGRRMDATDLIDILLLKGKRVSMYNIEGRWIDIGSPDDYRHACEVMKG